MKEGMFPNNVATVHLKKKYSIFILFFYYYSVCTPMLFVAVEKQCICFLGLGKQVFQTT